MHLSNTQCDASSSAHSFRVIMTQLIIFHLQFFFIHPRFRSCDDSLLRILDFYFDGAYSNGGCEITLIAADDDDEETYQSSNCFQSVVKITHLLGTQNICVSHFYFNASSLFTSSSIQLSRTLSQYIGTSIVSTSQRNRI